MDNKVLGINEAGLETLIKDLEDAIQIVNEKLSRLQSVYVQLGDCCKGAELVNEEFLNNITKVRETIEFNFDSYAQDLKTLQHRLTENDKYLSTLFEQATADQAIKNLSFRNEEIVRDNKKVKE